MFFDFDHLSENDVKISSVFAGKKHTEETLSILRVPKSEEHKRKIGLGNKGKHGPEAAHPRYGKKHSEETKAKIRAARLSKKNAR